MTLANYFSIVYTILYKEKCIWIIFRVFNRISQPDLIYFSFLIVGDYFHIHIIDVCILLCTIPFEITETAYSTQTRRQFQSLV